jgi:hypothetical protein
MIRFSRSSAFVATAMAVAFLGLAAAPDAEAVLIRVSQESSAGAGDFDANVLGFVDPFVTALSTGDFYQYGTPHGASYNGELNGGPNPVSSLSQIFLVDASDGLSLVVVHDNPNDGSGGSTRTRWDLLGGDTADFRLGDDPGEGLSVTGGTQFNSVKNWAPCCTDGYAIGSLDGMWTMYGQFTTAPTGITDWAVVDSDFSSVDLTLAPGQRVRLDPVPEPATVLLFSAGLAGLLRFRRSRRKS